MKLIRYKSPYQPSKKPAGGGIDYLKWDLSLNKLIELQVMIKNVLNQFTYFESDFNLMPIKIRFGRLLPKTDRIELIFKNNDKSPKQIGSYYIFENKKIIDQIDIVYSCSREDIENTLNNLNELIDLWPQRLINKIIYYKNQYIIISSKNKKDKMPEEKNYKNKINDKINEYVKQNNLKKFANYYNEFYKILKLEITNQRAFTEGQIITFFDIDSFENILKKLKIKEVEIEESIIVLEKFINLDKITLNKIVELYPFLISNASRDLKIEVSNNYNNINKRISIDKGLKTNGVIGVIDSYGSFSNGWESYVDYVEEPFPNIKGFNFQKNYSHGTSVSTLIIGHDIINPKYKDDLGVFKVKLFGILPLDPINMFYFMKKIDNIIKNNSRDIKIWNLSINSENDSNGISLLGQYFDILQKKYNVLFIVSAGNNEKELSAGADSLSAITVGSLFEDKNGILRKTSYSGSKEIFGRFIKPNTYEISNDIYNEESSNNFQYTIDSEGYLTWEDGTSFSAPLTARKCCYLMNEYKLSLESVKAIINLLSEISEYKIPNILFDNNTESILLIVEGVIKPKEDKFIEIILPTFENEKLKQDFTYGIGLSYFVVPSYKLGDEYSSINLEFKITNMNIKGGWDDIFKSKGTSKTSGKNATEVDLIKHFKKYDPNKVLINKDFINPKGYARKTDKFYLRVSCSDLFSRNDQEINYGCAIVLKEKMHASLINFELLNIDNIIEEEINQEIIEIIEV
ncbi:serine protease [Spiroplasma corruscae]|uniref:Serine protease n=1 Tax=Spiroplasma corruscae TaxID=216934 RepID=A0A222EPD1_9MOLU|nr:S8 family serine peptidase [Spiroplasma corruscae]ASP28375.1 serine protease [Spiroplasma corruscae]